MSRRSSNLGRSAGGCPPLSPQRLKGLSNDEIFKRIVEAYIAKYRDDARAQREFYEGGTLRDAIDNGAMARWLHGDKHPHQNLIKPRTLRRAKDKLLGEIGIVRRCRRFADLYALVDATVGKIWGIGRLAVYDIAQRIGAHLGLEPELVYLHRGAMRGARKLGLKGKTLQLNQLPEAFLRLSPAEAEDCLCIYEKELPDLRGARRRR